MIRTLTGILASIVLGFISAVLLGESDDGETIALASIFWLLALIHYRVSGPK